MSEDAARSRSRAVLPGRAVWIEDRVCRGDEASLSVFDRGARDGEGLFETMRLYAGRPFLLERHLERLVLSAAELGFPVPPSPREIERALAALIEAEPHAEAVARLTVTRGVPGGRPTRVGWWMELEPLTARLWRGTIAGAATAIVSRQAFELGTIGRHKTTSRLAYHLAREEARARRADEALLVSHDGHLLEGSVSNLFVVLAGEILTPPLAQDILPGITRAIVFELCAESGLPVRESPIRREELGTATEAFLTNAVQEIVPLGRIEDREFPGRATALRLLEAYRMRVTAGARL